MIKIMKYGEFENFEYRKGSDKFGPLVTRLVEFLRLVRREKELILKFDIKEFEKKSGMKIEEIVNLCNANTNRQLFGDFDIIIDNGVITFDWKNEGKSKGQPTHNEKKIF